MRALLSAFFVAVFACACIYIVRRTATHSQGRTQGRRDPFYVDYTNEGAPERAGITLHCINYAFLVSL